MVTKGRNKDPPTERLRAAMKKNRTYSPVHEVFLGPESFARMVKEEAMNIKSVDVMAPGLGSSDFGLLRVSLYSPVYAMDGDNPLGKRRTRGSRVWRNLGRNIARRARNGTYFW